MKKIILSLVLVLIMCTQSLAETSVWKVQKGDSVMFLGGTFHLLRPSDFPLPVEFDKAYKTSDILVFETDIGALSDPSIQQKLMAKAVYTDGTTIEDYLSPNTYKLLADYCASSGLPLEKLKQLKPSIISLTMTMVELGKLGVAPEGVDLFYYKLALKDGKNTQWLESVDVQIDFIASMGEGNEDGFINYSIKDLENIKNKYEAMVAAWVTGNIKQLDALFVAETKKKMPIIYKELLVDRNNNWLPMIEAYGKTAEKEFILVGAAHLVGPDGVIEALRDKGFTVEKM